MATPSPYATSTQARFWTYTISSLGALTTERHAASRALIEGSSSGGGGGGGSINISHNSSDAIATAGGKRRERPITNLGDADGSGGDEGGAGRSVKRARSDVILTTTSMIGITSDSSTAIAGTTHSSSTTTTTTSATATAAATTIVNTNPLQPTYLTFSEEESILNWASISLLRLCRRAPFDRAITSTALIFFQRFYSRARLVEYLPHEVITACIFLAIKAEACPYTEVEPLTRRLSLIDASWRQECDALLCTQLINTSSTALIDDDAADSMSSTTSSFENPWYLSYEVSVLRGIKFHLCVYAPFRGIRTLLRSVIKAWVDEKGSTDAEKLANITEWDTIQTRAIALGELALLSQYAVLCASPAHIAASALLLAADIDLITPVSSLSSNGLSLYGSGGIVVTDGTSLEDYKSASLLPSLAVKPSVAPATFLIDWINKRVALDASSGAPERVASVINALRILLSSAYQVADSAAPPLVTRLTYMTDDSLRSGTPLHTARLACLRTAMEKRKAQKPFAAQEAVTAFALLRASEDSAWGINMPDAD